MSERIVSTTPCPLCHGSGKRGQDVCCNCNGTGNIPVYEKDQDYPPGDD